MHILFVCTGNTCRSPMAAQLAMTKLRLRGLPWNVSSAGVYAVPGLPMSWEAEQVLLSRGIAPDNHVAQSLTADKVEEADLVVTMTRAQADEVARRFPSSSAKVHPLGHFLSPRHGQTGVWGEVHPTAGSYRPDADRIGGMVRNEEDIAQDIADPIGGGLDAYERAATEIDRALDGLIEFLLQQQTDTDLYDRNGGSST